MKRFIIVLLSLFLVFNLASIPSVTALSEDDTYLSINNKYSPMINCYECNKNEIKPGDCVNITVDLVDPNIKVSESILNSTVSIGIESSFSCENAENKILNNFLNYDSLLDGTEICLQLNNNVYFGNGHKLSVNYHIETERNVYENSFSFCVMETMYSMDKNKKDKQNCLNKTDDIKIVDDLNTINDVQNSININSCGTTLGNDQRVVDAQKWLNATYTGKHGYTPIPEDGVPGVIISEALVTALQIELGIEEPTGYFGGQTAAQFTKQCGKLSQGQKDVNKPYIRILQHALFCKGYNPTAVTGTFADKTASAIKKLKQDAGFTKDIDESVDAMWFKAILSSDAYVRVNNGDEKIRQIQQALNRDYYQYCGIMPCDGHYSRDTNEALIYALQSEEGLDTNTANGNFGPTTKRLCPNLPKDSRYSSTKLSTFIKILQYSLYFNKVEGYKNISFNGIYDSSTRNAVQKFQEFACLTPADGNASVGTIMSLMVSTGDPDRTATGCDCATQLDFAKAKALHNAGYRYVGRYLTGYVGKGVPKNLTYDEFKMLSDMGIRTFPIYQDGGYYAEYFNKNQGIEDAKLAIEAARNVYIPPNAIIYFAVDYDFMDVQVTSRVIPYFEGIYEIMKDSEYRTGIYGSRNICSRISDKGYACSSFVSDMSTGYSGNYGYPLPSNWAFDQFDEYTFSTSKLSFDLDKDAVSGRDQGVIIGSSKFKYSNYNRKNVRNYIDKWWNLKNPDYKDLGDNNCANFVSQCIFAGGIPMNDRWYCYKISNVLSNCLEEKDVDENQGYLETQSYFVENNLDPDIIMDYYEELDINGNTPNAINGFNKWDISDTWKFANKQFEFFSNKGNGFINGEVLKINISNIESTIKAAKTEGKPIQVGDLMYFVKPEDISSGRGPHHAAIVSKIDNNMIYYAGNSNPQREAKLDETIGNEWVYIVRLNNSN